MEIRVDGVNIFNPLEGKLDQIIDCMVEFYGEKYRVKIESKLKNTEFIFVHKDDLKFDISSYFTSKKDDVAKEVFSKFTDEYGRAEVLDYRTLDLMLNFKDEVNYDNLNQLNAVLRFLKVLKTKDDKLKDRGIFKDSENYSDEIFNEKNDTLSLNEMKVFLEDANNKAILDEFLVKLTKEYVNGNRQQIENIENERLKSDQKVQEIEKTILNAEKEQKEKIKKFANENLEEYIGDKFSQMKSYEKYTLIDKYTELLNFDFKDSTKIEFMSEWNKNEYIKFFKALGYNYGNSFEDYIKNIEQIDILNESVLEKFQKVKSEAVNQQMRQNPIFQDAVARIQNLDLKNGSFDGAQSLYKYMNLANYAGAYIQMDVSKKDNQLKTIMVCSSALKGSDHNIIHECGHIIEASVNYDANGKMQTASGFDLLDMDDEVKDYDGTNLSVSRGNSISRVGRKYEALNEIINDYFAEQVHQIMEKRGVQINLKKQKSGSTASYSYGLPLVGAFIDDYKDVIIDSRMSGDPYAFAKVIGMENFNMLADICTTYLKQCNNIGKLLQFAEISNRECVTGNMSFKDLIYNYDWPEDLQLMIEQYKKMDILKENIKNLNNQETFSC